MAKEVFGLIAIGDAFLRVWIGANRSIADQPNI